jgi:hypothetical protein
MEDKEKPYMAKDKEIMHDIISDDRGTPTLRKISDLRNFKGW